LNLPGSIGRTRIAVVDKSYTVTDKNVGFNGNTLANEGMAADLAIIADLCPF
jgi:hypothetical protein